jgi:ribonuclease P protein component
VVYFLLRVEEAGERFREVEGGELACRRQERLREENTVEGVEVVEEVDGILQMGVSVGKRHFKRAVDRNLLKRRIREAYRKQKYDVKETLTELGISMDIFFVYSNARISDYAEIETAMTNGLSLLKDKISAK